MKQNHFIYRAKLTDKSSLDEVTSKRTIKGSPIIKNGFGISSSDIFVFVVHNNLAYWLLCRYTKVMQI
jgi:hypothetical protein